MPWIERGGELVLLAANGLPLPSRGERPQNASVCVCIVVGIGRFTLETHQKGFIRRLKTSVVHTGDGQVQHML